MGERDEQYEAELFLRIESRLVAVEIRGEGNAVRLSKLEPVVAELRDKELLADAIADKVRDRGRTMVTRATIAAAVAALFVPPVITALLVRYLA